MPVTQGYPEGVLERLQQAELSILEAVDGICRENGLTYFLDGGSALGYVRHGGFIPWDDDIDIGMPLEDFKKFIELAPVELPGNMSVHYMENTENFYWMWAKVFIDGTLFLEDDVRDAGCREGIFIDIFPYIRMNRDKGRGERQLRRTQVWTKASYLYHIRLSTVLEGKNPRWLFNAAWRCARAFVRLAFDPARIRRNFLRACAVTDPGQYWGNPAAARPYPFHHDDLFPVREVDFDGLRVYAPHDCDAFLTEVYGEYMRIPAPEERHVHTPTVLDFGDGVNAMA